MPVTFKGGLHFNDYKEFTNKKSIVTLNDCPMHYYPLQQHIGAPLSPLVKVGHYITVGEKIADADAFVSAPLHSSVSGTVEAIKPYVHPSGATVTTIIVKNDFEYKLFEGLEPKLPDKLTSEEILKVIREAGIVGMGGAGFPTHVKLSPSKDKKITHIIVNGAECEPYLTSDHRRMLETTDYIFDGLKIVMKLLSLNDGYIGIEMNKPDAIKKLSEMSKDMAGIHIVPLKTKYPQGAEKQLIYAVTKREVPSGGLPADAGAIVLNIDTVTAISRAFREGMPAIEKIVTVSGDCISEQNNFRVPTGVPISYLIEKAGGLTKQPKKVIMGGPMMGIAQYSLNAPITKTSSAVLALSTAPDTYDAETPCIRCGKCVNACPMHLMPLYLNKYAAEGNLEMAEKYNILDCIECGVCSYLCPGKQAPLQSIRVAKQQILENRRKK